jgi:hypothetical protein
VIIERDMGDCLSGGDFFFFLENNVTVVNIVAMAEWQWLGGSVWYRWKEGETAVILRLKTSESVVN